MANEVTIPMLEKVRDGHALSNEALKRSIEFYTELSANLDKIAFVEKGYTFAANHARHELERLKMFERNRKDRRLNS